MWTTRDQMCPGDPQVLSNLAGDCRESWATGEVVGFLQQIPAGNHSKSTTSINYHLLRPRRSSAMPLLARTTRLPGRSLVLPHAFRRTLIPQPPPRLISPRPLPTALRPTSDEARANTAYMQSLLTDLTELRRKAREGGGKASLERWKSRGKDKLGARER